MEEGTTQEKYGDERVLYTWCDDIKNVEPKKKKGTLAKIAVGGGGLENRLKVEIENISKIF